MASPLNAESRAIYAVLDRPSEEDAKVLELLDREIAERQRNGEYPRVEIMGVGAAVAESRHGARMGIDQRL